MVSGSCLCGDVTFAVVFPSKWVAHCHCTLCQRAHGAAFVTWVSVLDANCTVFDPAQSLRWYASTPVAERGFCARCGSTMFFRSAKWPGEIHITRANFSTDVDRLPQVHAFYDSHVDWFTVSDNLPLKYDKSRTSQ